MSRSNRQERKPDSVQHPKRLTEKITQEVRQAIPRVRLGGLQQHCQRNAGHLQRSQEKLHRLNQISRRKRPSSNRLQQRSADSIHYMQLVVTNCTDPSRPGYQPNEDPNKTVDTMINAARLLAATRPGPLYQAQANPQEEVQENQQIGQENQNQQPPPGQVHQN